MNIKMLKAAIAGFVLTVSGLANAALISTGYNSDSSADGILFDIKLNSSDLNFQSMTFLTSNLESVSTGVELYFRSGSYVGFSNDATGWNLLFSGTISPIQTIAPTLSSVSSGLVNLDFSDFVLSNNSTYAFYLVTTDQTNVRYENSSSTSVVGGVNTSNADLTIFTGESQNFSGDVFSPTSTNTPRDFRGSFTYSQVPAPSTLAIFMLGIVGLIVRRLN